MSTNWLIQCLGAERQVDALGMWYLLMLIEFLWPCYSKTCQHNKPSPATVLVPESFFYLGRTGRVEKEVLFAWADAAWSAGIHHKGWDEVTGSRGDCRFQDKEIGVVACTGCGKVYRDSAPTGGQGERSDWEAMLVTSSCLPGRGWSCQQNGMLKPKKRSWGLGKRYTQTRRMYMVCQFSLICLKCSCDVAPSSPTNGSPSKMSLRMHQGWQQRRVCGSVFEDQGGRCRWHCWGCH